MGEYENRHYYVKRERGPASDFRCWKCPHRANDWAKIQGDGTDVWADYLPMCHSCHMTYDLGGRPRSAEARAAISAGKRGRPTHRKTQDEKDRISATLKGRPSPMTGRRHSEETKAKMRAAHAKRLGR